MNLKFLTLVSRYENEVYTLALYLLRDRSDAEDIAQETYIKLWENLEQIDFMRAKSWLMKVTRNKCLDRLRRRVLENQISSDPLNADQVQGPADTLVQKQQISWLRKAIENLNEPYRSLIVLRDIQQNSYNEIARTLELNLDQVKVYLYRARQQLKSSLQEVET